LMPVHSADSSAPTRAAGCRQGSARRPRHSSGQLLAEHDDTHHDDRDQLAIGDDRTGRGTQARHAIGLGLLRQDRQDPRQLRQHAHCTGRFRRQRRPNPFGGPIAGAAENLFGTTLSANSSSTAFELSGTGIQVARARPPRIASMAMVTRACCRRTSYIWEMNGTGQIDSGSAGNPKPRVIGSPIPIESTCPICAPARPRNRARRCSQVECARAAHVDATALHPLFAVKVNFDSIVAFSLRRTTTGVDRGSFPNDDVLLSSATSIDDPICFDQSGPSSPAQLACRLRLAMLC